MSTLGQAHGVLVVEDDPDIREALCEILRSEGVDVTAAENGAVALELLRRGPTPCLIVLDLMMPVMDGWTFCANQRVDPRLARIPVLVVSATPRTDARLADLAAVGVLSKPVDIDALLSTIRQHC